MKWLRAPSNKALHLTAIPLRSIAAGELGRYTARPNLKQKSHTTDQATRLSYREGVCESKVMSVL
jgi:hypothetical protein